jgi:hypothetical protein
MTNFSLMIQIYWSIKINVIILNKTIFEVIELLLGYLIINLINL